MTKKNTRRIEVLLPVTLDDSLNALVALSGLSKTALIHAALVAYQRTHRSYVSIYKNRVLPTFGKRKVTEVTRADLQAWVVAMTGEGLAPQTVHHCYVALRKAFKYAQDDRLISYNPCDSIRLPRNADTQAFAPVFLTAAEVTGLRIRDLNLKAGHVEVRQTFQRLDGKWQVGTPKSRRSTREVPLPDGDLPLMLRRYLMAHPNSGEPDALLWPGRMPGTHVVDFDRVFDVASFRRNYLRPALRALDMPEMRFHDLRHTFASLALVKGVPLYEGSRYMGHSNAATTDAIYAHIKPGEYDTYRRLMARDAGEAMR